MPKPAVTLAPVLPKRPSPPNVEQSTAFGAPELKARGKVMACVPTNKTCPERVGAASESNETGPLTTVPLLVRQIGIKCKARHPLMPRKSTPAAVIEATVTSKGQITLPRAVRTRLGIRTGSRIRFTLPSGGGFEAHPVVCELEDLWATADQAGKPGPLISFKEMNAAKVRKASR
jgi:antitoxin PrlF